MNSIEKTYVWEEPLTFEDCPSVCAIDDDPDICERVESLKRWALASIPGPMAILGWEVVVSYPAEGEIGSIGVRYLLAGKEEWFNELDNKGK